MPELIGKDGDTVKLLRECDAGIKMGISSIDDVLDDVEHTELKTMLSNCKAKHEMLADEIEGLLDKHDDDGKDPNPMAKGMSWVKTNVKMMTDYSDATIADFMTDGCNMGVKSLSRYINQYKSADDKSKDVAKRLVDLEATLCKDIRRFL